MCQTIGVEHSLGTSLYFPLQDLLKQYANHPIGILLVFMTTKLPSIWVALIVGSYAISSKLSYTAILSQCWFERKNLGGNMSLWKNFLLAKCLGEKMSGGILKVIVLKGLYI